MDKQYLVHVNGIRIEDWVFDVIRTVEKELQANDGETLHTEKQRELLQNIASEVIKTGTTVNIPVFLSNYGSTSMMNLVNKCSKCGSVVSKPYGKFEITICECGEKFKE
ncbi:hypothetical protein P4I98_03955 [Bacillus cereus]|nr:hypothetical protein [Bacillus cereus]